MQYFAKKGMITGRYKIKYVNPVKSFHQKDQLMVFLIKGP